MIVFCFDSDKKTENIFRDIIDSNDIGVEKFYFNDKPESVAFSGDAGSIVAFIDTRIQEKKRNSFFLAVRFREKYPDSHIVFMSLYPEDMPLCFKNLIRPSGFLLKPIAPSEISELLHSISQHERKTAKTNIIHISTREYKYNIDINKVLYLSTVGKKLYVKMTNGEKLEFYGTLSAFEKEYDNFVRCHSGFLVNKLYIKGIKRGEVELVGCSETLPVSKKYKGVIENIG